MRDDLTDSVEVRRRAATWRWVLSVVVAAALLLATVVLVVRTGDSRSQPTIVGLGVASGLALCAVGVTWLESRRITRHLHRTIDRMARAESELRMLLDDLPEAVFSIDGSGRVRGANVKAAELTGRPLDEIAGRPLVDLFAEGDRDELTHWLVSPASSPHDARTLPLPRGDGSVGTVEVTHEQARGGSIVRIRDVTEREQRLRALVLVDAIHMQCVVTAP